MSERVAGVGEHNVVVGSPGFDPFKGPLPRWRMPMAELSAAQKTFGIDHPTCAWTGEPIQVGSGARPLWEQGSGR